ncbi:LysR substrate-binding domain-containing protein [Microvirga lotononidis]|uniref:Transcriptional regulator n=1 Tax=Microvirga lotononidis TaxID=864069 RepID=I4YV93_9HYPH|nr:LysR substrate-binding domain-containing protein [Microvirga lotononidis]EIM27885.1 transcriptional regulator [Microvirga lotononidis]WQO27987.1 LysR substrate-binding domain-containing protein [Microvirga lotononidis]
MKKLPPLNALRAFESAARHLSFRLAAAELGVTPTAISHQIRLLEESCGQSLFRRRPRPLRLTAAGEMLFPVLRNGFDSFAAALASLPGDLTGQTLRVTTPNAFASRWLVPRLPKWREIQPQITLEVIGTDRVLNLASGEADVAIRYARHVPSEHVSHELFRDAYFPVCRPELLPEGKSLTELEDLCRLPRIHYDWMKMDAESPTWRRWWRVARDQNSNLPRDAETCQASFREEAHAIAAVLAGQGVAICSDIILAPELERGELVKAHRLSLPGLSYYLIHRPEHRQKAVIAQFANWLRSAI